MSITLEEFIKFRNPTGSDKIIQLMQQNRRLNGAAASKVAITSEPPPTEPEVKESPQSNGVAAPTRTAMELEPVVSHRLQWVPTLHGVWEHPTAWIILSKCTTS